MSTPIEQIEAFIKAHPGEWLRWSREGSLSPSAYATLRLHNLPSVCITIGHMGVAVHTREGGEAGHILPTLVKAPSGADLLTKIVFRVADSLQFHGGLIEWLPPWLQDPVRVQLRQRAATLLALADGAPPYS